MLTFFGDNFNLRLISFNLNLNLRLFQLKIYKKDTNYFFYKTETVVLDPQKTEVK